MLGQLSDRTSKFATLRFALQAVKHPIFENRIRSIANLGLRTI